MNKLIKSVTIITLVALLGFLGIKVLKAQSDQSLSGAPLLVAPATQGLEGDPGTNVSFVVRYYNTAGTPVSGTVSVADFIVKDNQGTPIFLEGAESLADRYSAAKWVSLNSDRGTIPAAGMMTVNGTIKIPKNASAGGKYFAVFFEPDSSIPKAPGGKAQSSATTLRLAALVSLRVSGAIIEDANVIRFTAPIFSEFGPVPITTEIKNYGDYHITPEGVITVKNWFGRTIAKADFSGTNIFPGASREIISKVGQKWMLGRFSATLDAKYGDAGKLITASLAFWVIPWKLIIIILLALIIIALVIYIIFHRFIRKEKQLEKELKEEKEELEELKEKFEDKIGDVLPTPKSESSESKGK